MGQIQVGCRLAWSSVYDLEAVGGRKAGCDFLRSRRSTVIKIVKLYQHVTKLKLGELVGLEDFKFTTFAVGYDQRSFVPMQHFLKFITRALTVYENSILDLVQLSH